MGKRYKRNAIRQDVLRFLVPAAIVFTAGIVVSALGLSKQPGSIYALSLRRMIALALIVTGLTIELIAQATLWRSYCATLVIRHDHQLIKHGIYRFARHPIYVGAMMVSFGVPMYTSSLYGLLIMSALIPLVLVRIHIEEKMLTEEFGDAYRTYAEGTSRLIPFVY